ncbi:MAG: hypothetical protein IJI66_15950 [Erysipelotrichaceae bacterium]|nr:hypothetical protein [Clostridia bacterium]MBR0420657.1 hypothetical protein [Erysipelotrichaceae bacterium]
MNDKKNKNTIRFLSVKDGNIDVAYTDDFIQMMKNEYDYFFDTSDHLFDRYPDIRVFVKDESLFTENPTVYYYQDNEPITTFNGTVFFAKLGMYCVRSLSKKEVSFLLRNLKRNNDDIYSIDAAA